MPRHRPSSLLVCALVALFVLALWGAGGASAANTGGAAFEPPPPPPKEAKIVNGRAVVPAGAPARVARAIRAANRIVRKPYLWGGGHGSFTSSLARGYDCSGAVSHALHGGRFLRTPMASGDLMSWGRKGPGRWITVYAHSSHAYVVIAGLRFDTSMHDADAPGPGTGPRWSKTLRRSAAFQARHPKNY
jgi:cell wall-associated NlpC family hydrolase